MSQHEDCGCTDNNCPHRTSEVNLFDGMFTNISVPSGAGLNEVLALLENYIITVGTCNDINYTLNAFSACLNLPAGTYSYTQITDAIVLALCANAASIEELQEQVNSLTALTTTNTLLTDIVLPSCFTAFTGTTSTDLFNLILTNICELLSGTAPDTGNPPIVLEPVDPDTQIDPDGTNTGAKNLNARIDHVAEALKSFVDNHSFMYQIQSPIVDTKSFVVKLSPMRGVIENFLVIRNISEDLSVSPNTDTYFYLSGGSNILRRAVPNLFPTPTTPIGSHPLYKVESDGSGVFLVTNIYTDNALNPIPLVDDAVDTVNVKDFAITSDKINPVTSPNTIGYDPLIKIEVNKQGQVVNLVSNLFFDALTNKQILVYNSALNRFQNAPNTSISSVNSIPKGNATGDDYDDSSISESASQVAAVKKIEINNTGGAVEDDGNAILNLVGGPFKMPKLTAAQASALPLTDGYFVYLTDTNVTFTSIGFWGVENNVWTKL